mgnify:CR=1 FL=1
MAKLSKLAAKRKAARDKKAAMTPDRRRKKAAKKKGKNIRGKDYDHKTKRFTSIKNNRGNRGKGTKKEK